MGNKNTKLNDQQATTPNTISSSQSLNKISGPTPNGTSSAQRMKHSTTFTNTSSNTLNRPSQNKNNPSTTNSTSNTTTTTTIVANLVASPLTFRQKNFQHYQKKQADVVNLNQAMRAKQNDLTNIIKQIDSNHASYQHASGSKLYKPSSFLNNTHANTRAHANHERTQANGNKKQASLSSSSSSSKSSSMTSGSPMQNGHKQNGHAHSTANINTNKSPQSPHVKHVKISPEAVRSSKTNSVSSLNTTANSNTTTTTKNGGVKNSTTSKLTKKFGLSPRFKRKIVETIKNGVQSSLNHSSSCDQANQKFNQVCDCSRCLN